MLLKDDHRPNATRAGNGSGLLDGCAEPDLEKSELGQGVKEIREVYRENSPELIRYARKWLGSSEAAQDVVQQAFTNTLTAIEQGARIRNMVGFLQRCVHNICVNSKRHDPPETIDDELCRLTEKSTEASAELRARWREVSSAVDSLGPDQRCVFVLAELKGLKCKEIAREMNCTTETVWQLLSRARKQIRDSSF